REAKRAALAELRAKLHLQPDETLAAGDGANDLSMLAAAGLGVAYNAKPAVAAAAHARIDHGELTASLYVQGYRRDEFVAACRAALRSRPARRHGRRSDTCGGGSKSLLPRQRHEAQLAFGIGDQQERRLAPLFLELIDPALHLGRVADRL